MNLFTAKHLLLIQLSLCAGLACAQQVYKWTDENGKVHYGDQNTAPSKSRQVEIKDNGPKQQPRAAVPAANGLPSRTADLSKPINVPAFPSPPPGMAARPDIPQEPIPPIPKLIKPGMSKDPQVEKEAQCIALGLEIMTPGNKFPENKDRFDKIANLCPGKSVTCHFFKSDVNKNNCVLVAADGKGPNVSRSTKP